MRVACVLVYYGIVTEQTASMWLVDHALKIGVQ